MGGRMPVNSWAFHSSPTPIDDDMLDSNVNEQRPSLPTSLSDFALLPTSSSAPPSPSSLMALDDGTNPFFRRLRRSSLLACHPITALGEGKANSPLATSITPRYWRRYSFDSEKMADESASETPSTTSSLLFTNNPTSSSGGPSEVSPTPPRPASASSSLTADPIEPLSRLKSRRASQPPKPARLVDLRSETNSHIESELKSEAQFQRLIASYSNSGFALSKRVPRTPRAWSDRGRYPEEVGGDEDADQEGESGSEDDDDANGTSSVHSFSMTPLGSGEEQGMTIDTNLVGGFMMDIDTPSSHSAVNSPTHGQQWRQTPPPTSSVVRSNKRKFDDRYDPYPTAAKRRAVSPSANTFYSHSHHPHSHSHQSHSHSHTHSHTNPHSHPHSHHSSRSGSSSHSHPPIAFISIPIPRSARSVTSSPILRPTSSPLLRPTSFPGHSPILKGTSSPTMRSVPRLPPLATLRGGSDSEREKSQKGVDGAGEAVNSLTLAE